MNRQIHDKAVCRTATTGFASIVSLTCILVKNMGIILVIFL